MNIKNGLKFIRKLITGIFLFAGTGIMVRRCVELVQIERVLEAGLIMFMYFGFGNYVAWMVLLNEFKDKELEEESESVE